jgi:hypothetical protein
LESGIGQRKLEDNQANELGCYLVSRAFHYASKYVHVFCVSFSMLCHSRRPGKHSKLYTQFATIRKQRSAYSNLYSVSKDLVDKGVVLAVGSITNARMMNCSKNSLWFSHWSSGCETRMEFILKQNKKAISIVVMKSLIENFHEAIREAGSSSRKQRILCMGLVYSIILFKASLQGSEGLKLDMETLIKYWEKGKNLLFYR